MIRPSVGVECRKRPTAAVDPRRGLNGTRLERQRSDARINSIGTGSDLEIKIGSFSRTILFQNRLKKKQFEQA